MSPGRTTTHRTAPHRTAHAPRAANARANAQPDVRAFPIQHEHWPLRFPWGVHEDADGKRDGERHRDGMHIDEGLGTDRAP